MFLNFYQQIGNKVVRKLNCVQVQAVCKTRREKNINGLKIWKIDHVEYCAGFKYFIYFFFIYL